MKELSIEEKSQRYDEALERARKCLDEKRDTCFVRPDVIFPELAESEDEKIRKSIIERFKSDVDDMAKSDCPFDFEAEIEELSKYIAWLEKQGKSKWTEEDDNKVDDIVYFLDAAKKHYASTVELDACIDWLKSLKERIGG